MRALFRFDATLREDKQNFCLIGIDESGRGPLAGPVVACAVFLPPDFYDPRLDDSKKLTPQVRERLYARLKIHALWGLGLGQVNLIDSINILRATHFAMRTALQNLLRTNPQLKPDLIAVDGRPIPATGFFQKSIVGGDGKSASIAAASVIAKVFRDNIMRTLNSRFPGYGLDQHKGYGTASHREVLAALGPSPIHRKSFNPVRDKLFLTN